ncbi:unnamed protein product [Sphenostylis stenocarpa]|uniref:Uncharacterized protein n=1 Tax=Sphenostylis stenocarpa TaxID=92480 RepID=A0AA86W073_9FABA|nr:unnamed protein product [Sphenostylis stenocarpa]
MTRIGFSEGEILFLHTVTPSHCLLEPFPAWDVLSSESYIRTLLKRAIVSQSLRKRFFFCPLLQKPLELHNTKDK